MREKLTAGHLLNDNEEGGIITPLDEGEKKFVLTKSHSDEYQPLFNIFPSKEDNHLRLGILILCFFFFFFFCFSLFLFPFAFSFSFSVANLDFRKTIRARV